MAVPLQTENLSTRQTGKSGNQLRQRSSFRQPRPTDFKHLQSSESVDGFRGGGFVFGREALAHAAVDAHHFDGRKRFGFEAQQLTRIGHAGLPTDGKVLAVVAVRILRRQNYCSNFITVCMSVLACANTAVAACCMICVRANSVLAAA